MINNILTGNTTPCYFYTNNKECDGNLHSYGFVINEDTLTEVGYRCKCDKCGAKIVLTFDPDDPKALTK